MSDEPKRPGKNFKLPDPASVSDTDPMEPTVAPAPVKAKISEPPPQAKSDIEKAFSQQNAAAVAEWEEPEFEKGMDEHPPCIDYEPPELNKMRDKVFKRKDKPGSEKRYLVTGIYPRWDATGNKAIANEDYKWIIHVNIFHFLEERGPDGKLKRELYTSGRYRPSGADIPAETFKALFELDMDGCDEVPHSFQPVTSR